MDRSGARPRIDAQVNGGFPAGRALPHWSDTEPLPFGGVGPSESRPDMGSADIQQNLNRLIQTVHTALLLLIISW